MSPRIIGRHHILPILVILSVLTISLPLFIPSATAEGETLVSIDPKAQTVSPGGLFTFDVACVPGQPIKAFEFSLSFNPSLMRVNSVSEGDIFDGYSTFFQNGTIDNTAGTVENVYGLILGLPAVTSSGTLVSISCTAKTTAGTSSLKLINVGVTNNTGYIDTQVSNGSVQIIQANQPPVYSTISPTNGSTNIPVTRTTISVMIRDPDGDPFDYTIQTRPNIGSTSGTNVANGTKTCVISGLTYGTTYRWYINATDGTHWVRRILLFTTVSSQTNNPPVFSNINPSNGSINIPTNTQSLSLLIKEPEGKSFDYTIQTSPDVGDVTVHSSQNGTKLCSISGLTPLTTYRWYVNATDGASWKRQWYVFTTGTDNHETPSSNSGGSDSPPPGEPTSPDGSEENTPPHPPSQPLGPTAIQNGVSYEYTSTAIDPDGDPVQLRFSWGDGTYSVWTESVSSNTSVTSTHTWYNASSYTITVIARDDNNSYSTWSAPLNVSVSQVDSEEEPVFGITTPGNIRANQTCQFDVSIPPSFDDRNATYSWEFGDGTTATEKNPTHIYQNPGTYIIRLTIIDSSGLTYTQTITVTVPASAQQTTQEKQGSLVPYLTIPLIGLIAILLYLFIRFFMPRTKIYSSKKPIHQHQTIIPSVSLQLPTALSTPTPAPMAQDVPYERIHTLSLSNESPNIEIDKKIDDAFLIRIHEIIDNL